MDFLDVIPLASCTAGGRIIRMISNNTLSEDVIPIFQVFISGVHRPDFDKFLVQPTRAREVSGSILKFYAPPQPQLDQIKQRGETPKIRLRARDGSGRISNNSWDFVYRMHGSSRRRRGGSEPQGYPGADDSNQECIFCDGKVD